MSELLSEDEKKWLRKLDLLLAKAPATLADKVSSYTMGDSDIILFDNQKVKKHLDNLGSEDVPDVSQLVENAGSDTRVFKFPFMIESAAG